MLERWMNNGTGRYFEESADPNSGMSGRTEDNKNGRYPGQCSSSAPAKPNSEALLRQQPARSIRFSRKPCRIKLVVKTDTNNPTVVNRTMLNLRSANS